MISQSSLEAPIYDLCKRIRDKDVDEIKKVLATEPIELPKLDNSPTLNQQNKRRLKVLISLITEIVARESNEPDYMLNKDEIEVEHIWSNHFDQHMDEFQSEDDFDNARNNIGDLLNRKYGIFLLKMFFIFPTKGTFDINNTLSIYVKAMYDDLIYSYISELIHQFTPGNNQNIRKFYQK